MLANDKLKLKKAVEMGRHIGEMKKQDASDHDHDEDDERQECRDKQKTK